MLKNDVDKSILISVQEKGKDPNAEEYGAPAFTSIEGVDNVENYKRIDLVDIALDFCVSETAINFEKAFPNAEVRIIADGCVCIDDNMDKAKRIKEIGLIMT